MTFQLLPKPLGPIIGSGYKYTPIASLVDEGGDILSLVHSGNRYSLWRGTFGNKKFSEILYWPEEAAEALWRHIESAKAIERRAAMRQSTSVSIVSPFDSTVFKIQPLTPPNRTAPLKPPDATKEPMCG